MERGEGEVDDAGNEALNITSWHFPTETHALRSERVIDGVGAAPWFRQVARYSLGEHPTARLNMTVNALGLS